MLKTSRIIHDWKEKAVFLLVIFLLFFGFATRFYGLDKPKKVVFDETIFGLYAEKYLSGHYYFDIHPPLGKMMLAASAVVAGAKPGFSFKPAESYADSVYVWMRGLPAFFGAILAVLIFFLVKELGFSRRASFAAGFMVLFDNALLVQSRFILLDSLLVFFVFLACFFYVRLKKLPSLSKEWYATAIILGLSLGAACSVKWIGFGILGLIFALQLTVGRLLSKNKKEVLFTCLFVLGLPAVLYLASFLVHFSLLPLNCRFDCGYMLEESPDLSTRPEGGLLGGIISANMRMLASGSNDSKRFAYESDWWSWPFMVRPVTYAAYDANGKIASYIFLGNPAVWLSVLFAALAYVYLLARNIIMRFSMKLPAVLYGENCSFLCLGYFFYLIAFAFVPRFTAIYHYTCSLIFGIMLAAVMLDAFIKRTGPRTALMIYCGFLSLVLTLFVFFIPFDYGIPLSGEAYKSRIWLSTWDYRP